MSALKKNQKHYQLSKDSEGHCLHHTRCFSPNDEWIVYDSRNNDAGIGSSGSISIINTFTGETSVVYQTENQTQYGPGVGAVSFSPLKNEIIFIHGLRNSNHEFPYAFNRRSAAKIEINTGKNLSFLDARNIISPYSLGALRGGTHAHLWDEKSDWISFTYDDFIMDQLSALQHKKLFKRTVGIMIPDFQAKINRYTPDYENYDGQMFSFIVAKTTTSPKKGSDEIDTAFDETWIGKNGYLKSNGDRQTRAIAFQANVLDESGKEKTEIFVVDLPDHFKMTDFKNTQGTAHTPPRPPAVIRQRRLTYTAGIDAPRHWLRSLPDGSKILFLNKDENAVVQLFSVDVNGGKPLQITSHKTSIEGPFNVSPDGKSAAYISNNEVVISTLEDGKSVFFPAPNGIRSKAAGAVMWSNAGNKLAYNRFVEEDSEEFLQIFIIELHQ